MENYWQNQAAESWVSASVRHRLLLLLVQYAVQYVLE